MAITERRAREILQKQYDRQNNFVKEKYDRIAVNVPKGMRDEIKNAIGSQSVNGYIVDLIRKDLEKRKIEQEAPATDGSTRHG